MLAISKVILKVNYDVRIFRKAPVQFCGIARNKIFQKINIQLNFYYSNIIPQINIQENYSEYFTSLTHFMPLVCFYIPRKHQKTSVSLLFSR